MWTAGGENKIKIIYLDPIVMPFWINISDIREVLEEKTSGIQDYEV
jgi:hypothetical protein